MKLRRGSDDSGGVEFTLSIYKCPKCGAPNEDAKPRDPEARCAKCGAPLVETLPLLGWLLALGVLTALAAFVWWLL